METIVYKLQDNTYNEGSPIIIIGGGLIKKTDGAIIVCLNFGNLSSKKIKAVFVDIEAFDIVGRKITGVSGFQYLDLNVYRQEQFGLDIHIPLPDVTTRKFHPRITMVVFSDDSIWESTDIVVEPIPKQQLLVEKFDSEIVEQYRIETNLNSEFVPSRFLDLWSCTCGGINKLCEERCGYCRSNLEKLEEKLDYSYLRQKYDERVEFERIESEKARIEASLVRKNRVRMIKLFSIIVLIVAILSGILYFVVIPFFEQKEIEATYEEAEILYSDGKYKEAAELYESLGSYEDAEMKAEEVTYQYGVTLIEKEDYSSAIEEFESILDYKDSQQYYDYALAMTFGNEVAATEKLMSENLMNFDLAQAKLKEEPYTSIANLMNHTGDYQSEVSYSNSNSLNIDTYGCTTVHIYEDGSVAHSGNSSYEKEDAKDIDMTNACTWTIVEVTGENEFLMETQGNGGMSNGYSTLTLKIDGDTIVISGEQKYGLDGVYEKVQ